MMMTTNDPEKMAALARDNYVRPLPKRFYKSVQVSDRYEILLDGRSIKTPLKAPFVAASRPLADAIAEEWRAQIEVINPGVMPLTRYANTAIDRATAEREKISAELVSYANSDLVCYRADRPPDLVLLQEAAWAPVVMWASKTFGAEPKIISGVLHQSQPQALLNAVEKHVSQLDAHQLTVLYNLTSLTGSVMLSMMMLNNAMTAEQGWKAANVDEDYQISQWGEDWEAKKRREGRAEDFLACIRYLVLSSDVQDSATRRSRSSDNSTT